MRFYRRLNQQAIFDPYRKIFLPNTPEERVRQKLVENIVERLGVALEYVSTEYPLIRIDTASRRRADIVIWYREGDVQYGLLVIEVKSDKIPMNDRILHQALDYRDILQCDYVGIANSPTLSDFQLFHVNEDGEILEIDGIPSYQELLDKVNITYLPPLEPLQRLPYEEMLSPDYWKTLHDEEGAIGEDTPLALKPFVAEIYNFIQAEPACKNLPIQCGHISINEDIGCSLISLGNPSGAIFAASARGFIIKDIEGNDQICRVTMNATAHTENHPKYGNRKGTSCLSVAVDNFDKAPDNVLELCLDRWAMLKNGRFELWHDGRMSNVKNNVVLQYITEGAPELLREGKVYFGSLPAGRSITWDDMRGVLSKVLLYAVLRKKLRGIKKEGKLLQ